MECDLVYAYNFLGATLPHLCLIMFGLYEFRRSPLGYCRTSFFQSAAFPPPAPKCSLLLCAAASAKATRESIKTSVRSEVFPIQILQLRNRQDKAAESSMLIH